MSSDHSQTSESSAPSPNTTSTSSESVSRMTERFFTDWALWQKLVFVRTSRHSNVLLHHVEWLLTLAQCLACAIVVVACFGYWKIFHDHRKLNKFSKLAEEERKDWDEHNKQTEMLQKQTMRSTNEKPDVAFGIRAIESGIKVEGVWTSPNSTPRQGSRNSSVDSAIREKPPRYDFDIDLEKQDIRKGRSRSFSNSSIGTARTHDRAISLDRGTSAQSSRSTSPTESPIARPPRSQHAPSSYVRYSCNPYLFRQSTSINTLEGLEAIHKASISINGQSRDYQTSGSDSSNQSSNSGNDVGAIAASAPNLFMSEQPQPRPRPRPRHNTSTDLELLNKHRTSQAAEVGQLTPRVRREANLSLDIKNLRKSSPNPTDSQLDYFSSPHRSRPSSSAGKSPENPFSPVAESPSSSMRRSSMPDVTPFTHFCQNAPLPQNRPTSSDSGNGARRDSYSSERMSIYETPPSSPILPASDGAAALNLPPQLTLPRLKMMSFDIRPTSQVLRGHGSGFEILRPGSLNPKLPAPAMTTDSSDKSRAAPPISLHNTPRPQSRRSSSIESGRKLQKKRRSSVSPNSFDSSNVSEGRSSRGSRIF